MSTVWKVENDIAEAVNGKVHCKLYTVWETYYFAVLQGHKFCQLCEGYKQAAKRVGTLYLTSFPGIVVLAYFGIRALKMPCTTTPGAVCIALQHVASHSGCVLPITVEPVIMNSPRWTYWAIHYGRLFIRREITKIYSKTTEFTYFFTCNIFLSYESNYN